MDDLYIEEFGETLREVRASSSYSTLRMLIEILTALAILVTLGSAALYLQLLGQSLKMAPPLWVVVWLASLIVLLILLVVFRGLALALLDIADAQLQQVGRNRRRES